MPDLPEQSRASREGHEPRPESDEVPLERRAVDTSSTEARPTVSPSGNGSGTRLGDPVTEADPVDDGPGSAAEPNGSASDVADGTTVVDEDATRVDGDTAETSTTDATDATEDADGGDEGEPPARERRARRSGWRSAIEWALVIGGALLVALVVRTFLVQAFWIPSASM